MWIYKILLLSFLVIQDVILDVMISLNGFTTLAFIITLDLVVGVLFITALYVAPARLNKKPKRHIDRMTLCWLSMEWISWLVYSLVLIVKIVVFYLVMNTNETSLQSTSTLLNISETYGQNLMIVGLSLSSFVLYLCVLTGQGSNADDMPNQSTTKWNIIHNLQGHVHIDILDATQLLVLVQTVPGAPIMHNLYLTIVIVTALNYILPTFALLLSNSSVYCNGCNSKRCLLTWKVLYFLAVNVSMSAVRVWVLFSHNQNVSVFLVKNVAVMVFALKESLGNSLCSKQNEIHYEILPRRVSATD